MDRSLETYVIHVTKRCNMKCIYCYEEDKTSEYTIEEIIEYVDNMLKFAPDMFTVEFLGGEPCLEWDKIKTIYEYIESKPQYNVVNYCITTNGTILTDEMISYLKDNGKLLFAASMDGTAWSNQLRLMDNGKNSHDIVMDNLSKLTNQGIDVSVHIVTHPFNIGFLYESVEHLYNNGIRSIGIGTVETTMDIDQEYCDDYINKLNEISIDIIKSKFAGLEIDVLSSLKPPSDVRNYIRDDTGKVIGESYGRVGNDITDKDIYNVQKCDDNSSANSEMIKLIRNTVFINHNRNKLKYGS